MQNILVTIILLKLLLFSTWNKNDFFYHFYKLQKYILRIPFLQTASNRLREFLLFLEANV